MGVILITVLLIIGFTHLILKKEDIIPYIIVYNTVFDALVYTFSESSTYLSSGRALFLYSTVFIFYRKYGFKINSINLWILIFVIYTMFISIFLSNNPFESIRVFLRVSFYLIYFDIVYSYYLNKPSRNQAYLRNFIYILIAYISYTLLANIFKLGTIYSWKKGAEEGFQTGDIIGDFLLQFSFAILLIPLVFYYNHKKFFRVAYILLSSVSLTFLLISARRTSVLIIIIGFIIFLFFYKRKAKTFFYSIFFLFIATIFILQFSDDITSRYQSRADRLEIESIEAEGRTQEYFVVTDLIFSFKDPIHSLFGKDLYAEKGILKNFKRERPLHTDYAKLLHGSGIIGFTLYLIFYFNLSVKVIKNRTIKLKNDKYALHSSISIMLVICKLLLSYTGGFHVISYNALLFGTLAMILAIQKRNFTKVVNYNYSNNNT